MTLASQRMNPAVMKEMLSLPTLGQKVSALSRDITSVPIDYGGSSSASVDRLCVSTDVY